MKTVLVTRPKQQAASFVKELEQYGLNSFVFPTIEIRPVSGWSVPDLSKFDGVFFTSPNSVSFFLDRLLTESPEELQHLQKLKIWAVGKTTSGDLAKHGVTTQPVPKIADAVTLMEEIGIEAITGRTFLFVRGSLSLGTIPDVIEKRGGHCVELTVYENLPPSLEETVKVKTLLEQGKLSCLSFTSPSTAINFFEAIESTALPSGVLVAAIGTTTASALEKIGLQVDIIPESFDGPGFAKAIAKALQQ
ncbi:uroporphyrinogen-III synthase [Chlorobium sp. BLA1]|uniref:uroporphyrinogen-III synthase n=1 Tax=Candidatus Chlorobium masyuteum TaxID=2716876 RepID=UPI00141EC4A5|nr:uroporphyrinogen-III synthase [Candidatus Chlorobium masyuteum]NHQ61207.1 uroporphyrinogen-III synthase [Candidatus Chlorobium masyuteum]NTU44449.1 uroporphyrinogen-III synthase [Chlorobiaceae bacterium]